MLQCPPVWPARVGPGVSVVKSGALVHACAVPAGEYKGGTDPIKTRGEPSPDGRELLSTAQVATLLDTARHTILTAAQRGKLHPAKLGRRLIFTRSEVVAWHRERRGEGEKLEREKAMIARFEQGAHPVDVYLETDGATLKQVLAIMHDWAAVAGVWVVEGPRGSYARWLQRVGLVELRPRDTRRVIEMLLADPYVAKIAGLALDETRAATAQADAAAAALSADASPPRTPSTEPMPRRRYKPSKSR